MKHPPRPELNRRRFLCKAALGAIATGWCARPLFAQNRPSNKVLVGVMGTSRNSIGGDGRGTELAVRLASLPGVEVAYICDVDERNVPKAIDSVNKKGKQTRSPKGVRDFRRILEDKEIDALVIAAPDHWHAPAAILGCAAGKHVYVEKPCCHNTHEGELLVKAARQHKRLVQHGTQRRSWPGVREAIQRLHSGELGKIHFVKSWYYGPRPTIGIGKAAPVPAWLDYDLWQGPAPAKPFQDNVVHYNWHWFWHWGTGELGNNGVHTLDVCRWGLQADYPLRALSAGGKYRFPEDDQETPDTNVVSFDFPNATMSWEQRSWIGRSAQDPHYDIAFFGEKGVLTIDGGSYAITDLDGKQIAKVSGNGGDETHLANFIGAIREKESLHAEIEEGYKSVLLCHLGNISYRTGRTIHFDAAAGKIKNDKEAQALWKREYRKGWEPKV